MQVKSGGFSGYRTARQWALRGYLPNTNAQGVKLWANPYCQASFVYFSPEEVAPASKEQIRAFFKPERDRRNQRERDRRRQRQEALERDRQAAERDRMQAVIRDAVQPYLAQIIADETKELDKDRAEYNKLYIMFLSDKFKLSGKDLFSAIEREHEQLEKLRESEQSDDDADSNSSVTDDEEKQDDTAVKHSSFPHSYSGGN